MNITRRLLSLPFYMGMKVSSPLARASQFVPYYLMFGGRLVIPVQSMMLYPYSLCETLYLMARGK